MLRAGVLDEPLGSFDRGQSSSSWQNDVRIFGQDMTGPPIL